MKPTIKAIVKRWLELHGYQGLCSDECGCELDDLMGCGTPGEDCLPGYIARCEGCSGNDFCIVPEKDSGCPYEMEPETVTDIDGNVYRTIKIGKQVWMAENLRVTHYRNGGLVHYVRDNDRWHLRTDGVCCVYKHDMDLTSTYGLLYNWHAVNDSRGIAPEGWHVPSDEEWQILVDYLGGNNIAGRKMKELGTTHWKSPNIGATNESGFSGLPGGYRDHNGSFQDMGYYAKFWSSTEYSSGYAWYRGLYCYSSGVYRYYSYKRYGFSVRCIKE